MLFSLWFYQLLRILPESVVMVTLGTALVRERYNIKQILITGISIGIIFFFVQRLPIEYGFHIPIGIIIYIVSVTLILKLNILKSAAAALLSYISIILIETITMILLINVMGYSEEAVIYGTDLNKFLFSLPSLVILFLFATGAQVLLRRRDRCAK